MLNSPIPDGTVPEHIIYSNSNEWWHAALKYVVYGICQSIRMVKKPDSVYKIEITHNYIWEFVRLMSHSEIVPIRVHDGGWACDIKVGQIQDKQKAIEELKMMVAIFAV
jgi:hypothetical protein